ncbi:MAG: DNA methyltransferase [Ignavibacteriales bacterium]|nr:MAG: DNA methyltransferase [Ignavibacteriales bacterium]
MKNFKISSLKSLLNSEDLAFLKDELVKIKSGIEKTASNKTLNVILNGRSEEINSDYFVNEITQIINTYTLERSKYYLKRLIKSLTEEKTGRINDINLNRWKEYNDVITDSLWILEKRDRSGQHKASYWGNFIPQIPNQLLKRFTKKGEWVLDTFLGSGTTLIECKRLGRNGIGVELLENIAANASRVIDKQKPLNRNVLTEIINADSSDLNYRNEFNRIGIKAIQFLIMHPPYWDIIKFSNNKKDLSNAETVDDFLKMFRKIVNKTFPLLDKGRYLALVIGDKYSKGEWIPLGFYTMQEVLKKDYLLKSVIVKNFEETKGKMNQKELWRYRALAGGFYVFKHEYIFLFQKK